MPGRKARVQVRRRAFIGLCAGGAAIVVAGSKGLLPKASAQTIGPPAEVPLAKWEWGLASHISEPMNMWRECEWPGYRRFPVRQVRIKLKQTATSDFPGEMESHILSDGARWEVTDDGPTFARGGMVHLVLLRNGSPCWVDEPCCVVSGDTLTLSTTPMSEKELANSWELTP